jgi:hypothetical protein
MAYSSLAIIWYFAVLKKPEKASQMRSAEDLNYCDDAKCHPLRIDALRDALTSCNFKGAADHGTASFYCTTDGRVHVRDSHVEKPPRFDALGLQVIVAGHGIGHGDSQKLLERVGFAYTHNIQWGPQAIEVLMYAIRSSCMG